MNTCTLSRLIAAALLGVGATFAHAASISRLDSSAANVTLDNGQATVRFVVRGTANSGDNCGYFVEYGDGMAPDTRIVNPHDGLLPRTHERTFTSPGTYTVTASGQRVKTTFGCSGEASTTVTVAAAPIRGRGSYPSSMGARPSCPEGWVLNERSVNWTTGAFSCTPKEIAEIACGEGLSYYEGDGVIGCRADRRARRDR